MPHALRALPAQCTIEIKENLFTRFISKRNNENPSKIVNILFRYFEYRDYICSNIVTHICQAILRNSHFVSFKVEIDHYAVYLMLQILRIVLCPSFLLERKEKRNALLHL